MDDIKLYKIKLVGSDYPRNAAIAARDTATTFIEDMILVSNYIEKNKFIKVKYEGENGWTLVNTMQIEAISE